MKYLILIDRKFPYKTGEAFLENEINEISKFFDKIVIFPIDVAKNEEQTRKILSENVDVIPTGRRNYKNTRVEYILNSIKYIFSSKNEAKNIKARLFEAYYLSICEKKTNEIIEELQKIKFKKKDEVYFYSYWLYTTASIAVKLHKYLENKKIKNKVFSRAHRFDIYLEETKLNYLPQRTELLKNLSEIYACSDNGVDYLKKMFCKYESKIKCSYLGTYDQGLCNKSNDRVFRIVSCSRVSKVKRVHLIAETLKYIENNEKNIEIEWTHIGAGEEFDNLKSYIENLKFDRFKVNLVGAIQNVEVYKYYNEHCADLFINVSSSEGLPVSIMEAISFGIPVIATDVGGTGEIVKNGISGFLINRDFETVELAKKIMNIYELPYDEFISLRKNTRNLWREKYQGKINYKNFANEIL